MSKILKLTSTLLVLPLAGCDLGPLDDVYNLTPCPVRIATSLSASSDTGEPVTVPPGNAAIRMLRRAEPYTQIEVVDSANITHRYDKDALAALRPSNVTYDSWGFTGQGLIFLDENPGREKMNQLAEQPCNAAASPRP